MKYKNGKPVPKEKEKIDFVCVPAEKKENDKNRKARQERIKDEIRKVAGA